LRPPARRYLEELGKDALEPLREAAPLLANPELCKTYDFEFHYDVARAHCVRTAIVRVGLTSAARPHFCFPRLLS